MINKTIQLTFSAGKVSGFSLGICISKYFTTIDLGFWYVGVEY